MLVGAHVRHGFQEGEAVIFERVADGIIVKQARTGREMFMAKPALNAAGECKLMIEGESDQSLELWQVSRKAIETLVFG